MGIFMGRNEGRVLNKGFHDFETDVQTMMDLIGKSRKIRVRISSGN